MQSNYEVSEEVGLDGSIYNNCKTSH